MPITVENLLPKNPDIEIARTVTGTTDTILASDNGKAVLYNTSGNCAVTVPDTLPVGFNCVIYNEHATSTVTFSGGGSMTLVSKNGTILNEQYSSCSLLTKSSTVTLLVGDLST